MSFDDLFRRDRPSDVHELSRPVAGAPGLNCFDSQFDLIAWRCLSLCRDAEAMRVAVVVGQEKLGLPVVSRFEF
jgi:hypothetical protein